MQAHSKGILIGNFVQRTKILSYLEYLNSRFKIKYHRMFVYAVANNPNEYLVTFKASNKEPFIKEINGATILHVKNGCIFSINALNKLIFEATGVADKNYEINWDNYKDTLVIVTNDKLSVQDIEKVEDKCSFFH